jgi:cytochrome c peroxidase
MAALGLGMVGPSRAGDSARRTPEARPIRYPGGRPPAADEAELGRRLFFDARLSFNDSISCASCHRPELGFSDGRRFSVGATGKALARHTPHLYNLAWSPTLFWDGRATSLEEQALVPIQGADEMNLPLEAAVRKLNEDPDYAAAFPRVYPKTGLTARTLAKALAAFVRTIVSGPAPFDRYVTGDTGALTPSAIRGKELFFGRAKCSTCHRGPNFTDGSFHNTGVPGDDRGRAAFDRVGEFQMRPYPFFQTEKAFKTPGLRNAALTAPYFHDGSEPTLQDVVRFYNQGGKERRSYGLALDIRPLDFDDAQLSDLVSFLEALTADTALAAP